jgi:hypothetical protein
MLYPAYKRLADTLEAIRLKCYEKWFELRKHRKKMRDKENNDRRQTYEPIAFLHHATVLYWREGERQSREAKAEYQRTARSTSRHKGTPTRSDWFVTPFSSFGGVGWWQASLIPPSVGPARPKSGLSTQSSRIAWLGRNLNCASISRCT